MTRAEGDTDAVASEHDGDRTLATVYHERRVQAERIDVRSRDGTRVATTFLILHGKGVAYRVDRPGDDDDDDATCVHAQTPGPAVQTRLSHVASSFRGKERVDDGRVAERWDGAVPGYGTRETVVFTRSVDGKRHAPIRSIFHRTDGGAVITVVTEYLAWNGTSSGVGGVNGRSYDGHNLKLDAELFRPPPTDLCAPDATGVLSKSLEHRNTLHFNPLHHPRVNGGGGRERAESNERTSGAARTNAKRDAKQTQNAPPPPPGGFRRGDGVARRRVAANKDGSKPAAPWESHGVDPEVAAKGGDARTRPEGTLVDSPFPFDGGGASSSRDGEGSSYSSREGRSGLNGRSAYNRDRGWVPAGIVDGIPASKDDGSGPAHEYALLGSGSDEL